MDEKAQFAIIEHAVMSWTSLARNQEDLDVLKRLVYYEIAKDSWKKLFKKAIPDDSESFYSVASSIGRLAVRAHRDADKRKTGAEIKEAGRKAAALVEELLLLICEHDTLQYGGGDLTHPTVRAALSRITRGLSSSDKSPLEFSPEIEEESNTLQKRDFPEYPHMTTSEALRVLSWSQHSGDQFQWILNHFGDLARESISIKPTIPNPGAENSDVHIFSLMVCIHMEYIYGTPNHDIVAGFASALFDRVIDDGAVNKWWQRRGDIYRINP